jgi:2-oxoglutarate ferredoxin oxidoreductase subunit alpha
VSGFQIHFGSREINTPGDMCDVLVTMNAAALKVNLRNLREGGIIIANTDGFNDKNLRLSGYDSNPLEGGSLSKYQVFAFDISALTRRSLEDMNLSPKVVDRSKNFFALGLTYWIFSRPPKPTLQWIKDKFKNDETLQEVNMRVLKAGYNFGETTEVFAVQYEVGPAKLKPGTYRSLTGNEAAAWGFISASVKSGLELFLGSYPITPASEILHELSKHKSFHVKTFQAEDEIAGICSAIGAAYGGALAITSTSGPGLALKSEAIGLAVITELPIVIIDVQRGGPSTGLPTKTEQADLLQAMYGRNGESPVVVLAATSPSDCFWTAYEASRIAVKYMIPVVMMSEGFIGQGSDPWLIPDIDSLPEIKPSFRTDPQGFYPYLRDEKTLARPWAIPGTPGLEHRIGGLEKANIYGNVSHDPENHELMVKLRQEKVDRIADGIPLAEVDGDPEGDLLVVGWGGTYGAIRTAVERQRNEGRSVSHLHLRYINPLQKNVGEILYRFKRILVPEGNLGQLCKILRARFLVPTMTLSKVQGGPFRSIEIVEEIDKLFKA